MTWVFGAGGWITARRCRTNLSCGLCKKVTRYNRATAQGGDWFIHTRRDAINRVSTNHQPAAPLTYPF